MKTMILLKLYDKLNDGYLWCYVIYFNNKKKSIPYHKYLWEKENGKTPKGYIIHHKDKNKLNNSLNNFELLTRSEHAKLHYKAPIESTFIELICKYCNKKFPRRRSYEKHNRKNKVGPFCGKSCAGKWSTDIQYRKISK